MSTHLCVEGDGLLLDPMCSMLDRSELPVQNGPTSRLGAEVQPEGDEVPKPQDPPLREDESEAAAPTFHVVVNHEEQYSIWDTRRALPVGWRATGFVGPEATCLAHIDEIWTDMRPLSLRRADSDG